MPLVSKITVIDDDVDLRNLLKISLAIHGYEVRVFANADEFIAASHNDDADLYIIDLNLGGITGHEVCQQLRAKQVTQEKLILLISANPEVQQHASDAGANGFLFKPFSQKELIQKIQSLSDK